MAGQSFRFLQAGSFQMHATLRGLTAVPEHLAELLIDAPFRSAAEVIQAAVREEVDFVLLCGDILDPTSSGPRAVAFLQQQFRQLHKHEIPVYWAASRLDLTSNWLRSLEWPDNVHIFASEGVEEVRHQRGDEELARLRGRSWNEQQPLRAVEFAGQSQGPFAIAVLHSNVDPDNYRTAVSYWALGGPAASTPWHSESCAHGAGAPQGLSPADCGPHGCSLVHVRADGEIRVQQIPTDTVRWCHEQVAVDNSVSRIEVRSALRNRTKNLLAQAGRPLLVRWTITGEERFDTLLNDEPSRDELLAWLRDEFGAGSPPAWSVSLELEPPESLPTQWCEEDSILGDFLRVVKRYQQQPEKSLELEEYLLDGQAPLEVVRAVSLEDGTSRSQLLRDAAVLGVDLLRGDESAGER